MDDFFTKRTIEFVLNKDNGSTIEANHFFLKEENEIFRYRNELQKAIKGIRDPLFVCYFCGQMIKIRGGGQTKKILHFAHRKDSEICHLKTDTHHSALEINRLKYNGAKESPLHFETKNLIKEFIELNNDFSNIKVESVVKSNTNYFEWKKPDISAIYREVNVVFEIQLSTTFLSVIVDREHFYKENQTYILWVFKNFELDEFRQRFTEKDVFYSNNRNAFILDHNSINLSLKNKDLYLLCYYQKPIIEDLKIKYTWESQYVCFNELIFDDLNYKIFYFDVELVENKLIIELKEIINKIEEEQRIVEAEQKRIQREKEIELEEERIQIEKEHIETRNERVNFLRKKELYSAERQMSLDERHRLFREINEDFFIRLKENYHVRSDFKNVFYTPQYELSSELDRLFMNGYKLSETDKMFLKVEFNIELNKKSKLREMEILYHLSLSTFYVKLKSPQNMFLLPKVERLLCSILSFKTKKIIGYSFDNLIQVAHHTFSKKENMQVFLNAIEAYYGLNSLLAQDKNKKLRNKILEFHDTKPEQSAQYNEIIKLIFPEAILNEINVKDFID